MEIISPSLLRSDVMRFNDAAVHSAGVIPRPEHFSLAVGPVQPPRLYCSAGPRAPPRRGVRLLFPLNRSQKRGAKGVPGKINTRNSQFGN